MSKATVLTVLGFAAGAATMLGGGHGLASGAASESDSQSVALRIGGAEAAGFFKEATGFDSESEVSERRR
jgi:hypothetical protein